MIICTSLFDWSCWWFMHNFGIWIDHSIRPFYHNRQLIIWASDRTASICNQKATSVAYIGKYLLLFISVLLYWPSREVSSCWQFWKFPQLGPFVDSEHPEIKKGTTDRSFDEIFHTEILKRVSPPISSHGSARSWNDSYLRMI